MTPIDKLLDPDGEHEIIMFDIVAPQSDVAHDSDDLLVNLKSDYQYARNNIRQVIETSRNLLPPLAKMANEQESARTMEVVSAHLKLMLAANKSLIDLHTDTKNTKGLTTGDEPDKRVAFRGTAADLLALMQPPEDGSDD